MKKLAVLLLLVVMVSVEVCSAETLRGRLEEMRKVSMPRAWATASVFTAMDEGGRQTTRETGVSAKKIKMIGTSLFTSLSAIDKAACLNAE